MAELSDPNYWINPDPSHFNRTIIDPADYVSQICSAWTSSVYGTITFSIIMIALITTFTYLSRRYPNKNIIIKQKEFPFAHRLKQSNPGLYKLLDWIGLTGISAAQRNLFVICANISEKAMWFRIIQLWLNLKFKYGVI